MQQQVVAEELPAPEVVAPSSSKKKVDASAAAVNAMLRRQRRCTLKIRQGQLQQLTELMFKAAQPRERAVGTGAAEGAAQQETAAGTGRGQRQAAKQSKCSCTAMGSVICACRHSHVRHWVDCCFGSCTSHKPLAVPTTLSASFLPCQQIRTVNKVLRPSKAFRK